MKRLIKLQSVATTVAATQAATAAATVASTSLGKVPATIIVLMLPRRSHGPR